MVHFGIVPSNHRRGRREKGGSGCDDRRSSSMLISSYFDIKALRHAWDRYIERGESGKERERGGIQSGDLEGFLQRENQYNNPGTGKRKKRSSVTK